MCKSYWRCVARAHRVPALDVTPLRACALAFVQDFMVRSAKEDLSSLIPPVTHTVVMLDFEAEHAKSYNSLVDVIRRNLLLADWFDPAHKESLLHSSQLKYQRQTLRQLQLSTCVAGHINIQSTESDIRETIQVGRRKHHHQSPPSTHSLVLFLSFLPFPPAGPLLFPANQLCRSS